VGADGDQELRQSLKLTLQLRLNIDSSVVKRFDNIRFTRLSAIQETTRDLLRISLLSSFGEAITS